jgi:hypothetical protein
MAKSQCPNTFAALEPLTCVPKPIGSLSTLSLVRISGRISSRPAPLLEMLYINCNFHAHCDLSVLEAGFFPHPRLRCVALPATYLPPAHSKNFFDVSHLSLSEHSGARPRVEGMLYVLRHTPNLSIFTYHALEDYAFQGIANPLNIVSLPALTKVELTAPGCGLDVLGRLDAPSLTDTAGEIELNSDTPSRLHARCIYRPVKPIATSTADQSTCYQRCESMTTGAHIKIFPSSSGSA